MLGRRAAAAAEATPPLHAATVARKNIGIKSCMIGSSCLIRLPVSPRKASCKSPGPVMWSQIGTASGGLIWRLLMDLCWGPSGTGRRRWRRSAGGWLRRITTSLAPINGEQPQDYPRRMGSSRAVWIGWFSIERRSKLAPVIGLYLSKEPDKNDRSVSRRATLSR